jgi:hypothetical protein
MRLVPLAAATLVGATLLASCGDDTPRTASPADPATTTSPPASPDETIPDGTYSKTVTTADARAAGVTDEDFLRELGKDGETTYAFKFAGDRWTVFIIEDGAAPEPGDLGTLEYEDAGDVAMVSESDGCPQCVVSYHWRLTGDRLSLTIVGHESTGGPEDLAVVRFVTEGDFTRQS